MGACHDCLGAGFKYFLFSPRNLGKIPILTHIFQMGLFNYQPVVVFDIFYLQKIMSFFKQQATRWTSTLPAVNGVVNPVSRVVLGGS